SENQLVGSTWTPSFYGYDGHGNVRLLTNTSGTVTDTSQYDAFGMPIASTGTTANNYRYSGEWLDSSIGLYHLRARYYNLATGRFWARDPVEGAPCTPLSYNPYIYASDDPVDQIDPTGDQAILESLNLADSIFNTTGGLQTLGQQINCGYQWAASYVVAAGQNIGYAGVTFQKSGACQETATHPKPRPPCFAQLKYRYAMAGCNHSFWWIQTSDQHQYTISGGPTGSLGRGTLNVFVSEGSTNNKFPKDNSGDSTAFDTGLSPEVCGKVDKLKAAADSFPNGKIDYKRPPGPNSNSVAHYLGQQAGFNPTAPPNTGKYPGHTPSECGWDTSLPTGK